MIPYEDLVVALATWRSRNGLPTGPADYLGEPPPPQPVSFDAYEERASTEDVVDLSEESLEDAVLEESPAYEEGDAGHQAAAMDFGSEFEEAETQYGAEPMDGDAMVDIDLSADHQETEGPADFPPREELGDQAGLDAGDFAEPAADFDQGGARAPEDDLFPDAEHAYGGGGLALEPEEATEIVNADALAGGGEELPQTEPVEPIEPGEVGPSGPPPSDETRQMWPAPDGELIDGSPVDEAAVIDEEPDESR